jgi:2-C-methyl-D-erythritol 4-phosphate cytidylyltransferase/2-C-methyl-D-erythritol 2,4-cyclodiphosphate synthase
LNAGTIGVVVVAAGRGERAGQSAEGPKQYRRIGGKAIIAHTLEHFLAWRGCGPLAVAIHPDDHALFDVAIPDRDPRLIVVDGAATRQASTLMGLRALSGLSIRHVMIHDGVRPFIDDILLDRIAHALDGADGVLPALAVTETLKKVDHGRVVTTVDRSRLYAAQTPQAFPFAPILEAHERAHEAGRSDFTDDAAIAEWAGMNVRLVEGSVDNRKLTLARDIAAADERLSQVPFPDIRTGNGYDVHSFEPGDHVTLCGVDIAHDLRLNGHSDADVALHALTDALLSTCSAGDIGTHFPPSDPQWKGVASRIFLDHAARLVRANGGRITHADVTLIAEAPRIAPHRDAMVASVAEILSISPQRVSVKATTNEKLGFVGRREGIAAIATATVAYPGSVPP